MAHRLDGKVALVTGAAQGIGAAIAGAMAREGAIVIYSDQRLDAATAASKGSEGASALALDVTDEAGWSVAAQEISERHGRLDILVNNAGIEVSKPIQDTAFKEWRDLMAVNLDGVFLGCRAMLPLLCEGGRQHEAGASVINISSVAGIVGYPYQVAYNASKAAVSHIAKSLAIEWGLQKFNIRANAIHPGPIRTQMVEEYVQAEVARGQDEADVWRMIADMAPSGRIGRVEDIAMGAVYLASDEAAFVNATTLVIDGGFVSR